MNQHTNSRYVSSIRSQINLVVFSFAEVLGEIWRPKSRAVLYAAGSLGWEHRSFAQLARVWGLPLAQVIKHLWPSQSYSQFMKTYEKLNELFPVGEIAGALDELNRFALERLRGLPQVLS